MQLPEPFAEQVRSILSQLYGDRASVCWERLERSLASFRPPASRRSSLWDQRDVVLITYADQVQQADCPPLQSLRQFLLDHSLDRLFTTVHLLPFFPYSSDDGFSVMDYLQVNPDFGDWPDVAALREHFDLMFDLVLNHCSRQHAWFQAYLRGQPPYDEYFIEVDPQTDLSTVVRPRSSPLLTPVQTNRGVRHVWTTFSADQVDLNYSNPLVLAEMLHVLLQYVQRGARIIRLDAIAYLWKKIGTPCIHLPEVHLVVKLFRRLLDGAAPGTLVLTETNVPHQENVSYFGDGDEAHVVYQFSLAPLLLDAFLTGDATPLMNWLESLAEDRFPATCTFLNFTASHDGIGVRPLEGLVSPERFARLIEAVRARGGLVSTRRQSDGTDAPYELNITYFSALDEPGGLPSELHARRFLSTQAVMLALKGIPGVYFHSLTATPNDLDGVRRTGVNRSINRRKFQREELEGLLRRPGSAQQFVFDRYRRMLAVRRLQPAFHPDAHQRPLQTGCPELIGFHRFSDQPRQNIWVLSNTSGHEVTLDAARLELGGEVSDLLSGEAVPASGSLRLQPWQTVWLCDTPG